MPSLSGTEQLLGSRDTSVEIQTGVISKRRRFFVPCDNENDARKAENVPRDPTETYPGEPTLLLVRVDAIKVQSGTGFYVDCSYSNRAGGSTNGRQPPPLDNLVTKKDWMWGSRTEVIEAPLNIRASYAKPTNTAPVRTYAWTLSKLRFQEVRVLRILKCYVKIARDSDIARFDLIAGQLNHLHLIRGSYYLYTPPLNNVRKMDDTTFEVMHVWEQDLGTKMPTYDIGRTPLPDDAPKALIVEGSRTPGYLRDPYAVLIATPPENPQTTIFDTQQFFPYPKDDDGWRTLPGVPDLG